MTLCTGCDQPITKGEARSTVPGEIQHQHCSITTSGTICKNVQCHWWMTYHGGICCD